jgi:hypothetical protein
MAVEMVFQTPDQVLEGAGDDGVDHVLQVAEVGVDRRRRDPCPARHGPQGDAAQVGVFLS